MARGSRGPARGGPVGGGARLTGGEAAGRRLQTLADDGLRASSGLLRAACFNILGDRVFGAEVLDLFAGIGSLGLEALSRGAARVTFVELQRRRAQVIDSNLQGLGWTDRGRVVVADASSFVRGQPEEVAEAGLVLMDPPYLDQGPGLCVATLGQLGAIADARPDWGPLVVVEHHRDLALSERFGALNCVRTARYGSSRLSLYRRFP